MEERWLVTQKPGEYTKIGKKHDISPVLARLIGNRDISGDEAIEEYLNGSLNDLLDGFLMEDMKKGVDIIINKIHENKAIRIIGDYDIDGVASSYILWEGLESLGAVVDSDIPDRIKNGYGLSMALIEKAIEDGIDTIITCDNGIAAYEEIAYAKSQGLTIIVTDHHEVPFEEVEKDGYIDKNYKYPPGDAVIDPKRVDCNYPFKELCGAGVAYKFVECMYKTMKKDFSLLEYLLEFVAIATIGDIMDLVGENRILVKEGLKRIHHTKNRGLLALMEVNDIEPENVNTYHIGFVLGPCLNASGRLSTAKKALDLFRANTSSQAQYVAFELKELNDERKSLTEENTKLAIEVVESSLEKDTVLVVYLPECHESIAGIIAGRVREKFHKPTIVMTKGESGIKGSGRSIETYDLYNKMNECANLFDKFGGHKLAAGLSMREENLKEFRRFLNKNHGLTEEALKPKVTIDMQLPLEFLNMQLVEEMSKLEPCGKGNKKPIFAERNLEVTAIKKLGANKNVFKCKLRSGSYIIEGIYFGDVEALTRFLKEKYGYPAYEAMKQGRWCGAELTITYFPTINEFRGNRTLQLNIQNYK